MSDGRDPGRSDGRSSAWAEDRTTNLAHAHLSQAKRCELVRLPGRRAAVTTHAAAAGNGGQRGAGLATEVQRGAPCLVGVRMEHVEVGQFVREHAQHAGLHGLGALVHLVYGELTYHSEEEQAQEEQMLH